MSRRYDRIAAWLLPRKRGAHIAVVLLTLLMIPGAMTALQPIDMESYEMESPELTAQTIVNEAVSYTHLRAHETRSNLVCRLLLEKKKKLLH